jgi:hypothetical protein
LFLLLTFVIAQPVAWVLILSSSPSRGDPGAP